MNDEQKPQQRDTSGAIDLGGSMAKEYRPYPESMQVWRAENSSDFVFLSRAQDFNSLDIKSVSTGQWLHTFFPDEVKEYLDGKNKYAIRFQYAGSFKEAFSTRVDAPVPDEYQDFNAWLIWRLSQKLSEIGADKHLHGLLSSMLFVLGGEGADTAPAMGLVALLDGFWTGFLKELNDRGVPEDEKVQLATKFEQVRAIFWEVDKAITSYKLDQGDLLADLCGLSVGFLFFTLRELVFRADEPSN